MIDPIKTDIKIVHNIMERAINWLHMSCSFLSSM